MTPMFTYHLFFAERFRSTNHQTLVKSVVCGISLILCMSFPASLGEGYRLDIRLIPLLLGTLYGGYRTGMFLLCLLIIYRMYIGIDVGFYITVLVMIFCFPAILFFQKSFNTARKEKKVKITVLLSLYYCLVRVACISDLTSVFAHEIRNPMQVTRGFLQLLNELDLPDKKKEYIQLSIEELDRAIISTISFVNYAKFLSGSIFLFL